MNSQILELPKTTTEVLPEIPLSELNYDEEVIALDCERTTPQGDEGREIILEVGLVTAKEQPFRHYPINPGPNYDDTKYKHRGLSREALKSAPKLDDIFLHILHAIRGRHVISWWIEKDLKELAAGVKIQSRHLTT